MAKTEKELQELKVKLEEVSKELSELSEEELLQVAGGKLNPGELRRWAATDDSVVHPGEILYELMRRTEYESV